MSVEEFAEKMKKIEEKLLYFITREEQEEENYENLIEIIINYQLCSNKHFLKTFLYLINHVSNNHHRGHNFLKKIEKVLKKVEDDMKKYFSSKELFKIFKKNKRILLFLFEEKLIIFDEYIYDQIMDFKYQMMKYPEYFAFEIKPFIEKDIEKANKNKEVNHFYLFHDLSLFPVYEKVQEILKEDFNQFNEKRKKGENAEYLPEIIRKDSIEEFITFVKKEDFPLQNFIDNSIFETNYFLLNRIAVTLIEYAAFHGSIQIFKYLYKNGAIMTPKLWNYAIHGSDEEIMSILEENNIEMVQNIPGDDNVSYQICLKESIKSHHNYITDYLLQKYEIPIKDPLLYAFRYANFEYYKQESAFTDVLLYYACKYDYYNIVEYLLNTKNIDVDQVRNPLKIAAFRQNNEIVELLLIRSGKVIKDNCFYELSKLTEFTIPSFIISIGNYAFFGCVHLSQITIPSSVKSIADYAFQGCKKLIQVLIPSSVMSIGKGAFKDCSDLLQIDIQSPITMICDETFSCCLSLIDVKIPSSVTSIGKSAFEKCKSLKSIKIPSSVSSIGECAFNKCNSLTQISIPSSLASIGKDAFPANIELNKI